jgi:hypothetical protein
MMLKYAKRSAREGRDDTYKKYAKEGRFCILGLVFFCILEAKALELDTESLPLKYLAVVDEVCTPIRSRVLTSNRQHIHQA